MGAGASSLTANPMYLHEPMRGDKPYVQPVRIVASGSDPQSSMVSYGAESQESICSQPNQVVISPTQTVPLGVAAQNGQMISAVPFIQARNTMISPTVPFGQSLAGLPTQQIPNTYVLTTAGTRYQMAMGGAGNVVPAAMRRSYGAPFPNC